MLAGLLIVVPLMKSDALSKLWLVRSSAEEEVLRALSLSSSELSLLSQKVLV